MAHSELSELGRVFEAAWREETALFNAGGEGDDPALTAAQDRTAALVRRIVALSAADLDGLRIKAQAFAWARGGDVTEVAPKDSIDRRALASLMRDLLAPSQSVEADHGGDLSPTVTAACARFDAAFAEWLRARADLADNAGEHSEAAEQARVDRERAAELALIATPAPHATAVWRKWELVEHILAEDADGGPRPYPAGIVALAALKADIVALGLKPWPDL